jgi:uncharacterized surface protein with fasciclin (FAS1) repeats
MNSRFLYCAATAAALFAGVVGCNMNKNDDMPSKSGMTSDGMMARGDIIDVATGPGMQQVTTLVTAVKAAGLVDTLKGPGPFTVFAPTNAAFAKLPPGTVDDLLKPENKEKLKSILLYHVVPGNVSSKQVMAMSTGKSVSGKTLNIKTMGDTVMVNDAKVIKADIPATNGTIHWIDTVLMPPM